MDDLCGEGALIEDAYAERFVTARLRDVAVSEGYAYAVDGTYLWTLDLNASGGPALVGERQRPLGHPIAVHVAKGLLWVATVDAGLAGYRIRPSGRADDSAEQVLMTDRRRVLDVTGEGADLVVSLGGDGVGLLELKENGSWSKQLMADLDHFAVRAALSDDRLAVASCDSLHVLNRKTLDVQHSLAPPTGRARGVAWVGNDLYVAAGRALHGFRFDGGQAGYLGRYRSAGAPVLDVASREGHVYVLTGDQTVRAIKAPTAAVASAITWTEPQLPTSDLAARLADLPIAGQAHAQRVDGQRVERFGTTLVVVGGFDDMRRQLYTFDVVAADWMRLGETWAPHPPDTRLSLLGDALIVHRGGGRHAVLRRMNDGTIAPEATFAFGDRIDGAFSDGSSALWLHERGWPLLRVRVPMASPDLATPELTQISGAPLAATSVAVADDTIYVSEATTGGLLIARGNPAKVVGVRQDRNAYLGQAQLSAVGDVALAYDAITGQLLSLVGGSEQLPRVARRFYIGRCDAGTELLPGAGSLLLVYCAGAERGRVVRVRVAPEGDMTLEGEASVALGAPVDVDRWRDQLVVARFDGATYLSTVELVDIGTGQATLQQSWPAEVVAVAGWGEGVVAVDSAGLVHSFSAGLDKSSIPPLSLDAVPEATP